VLSDAEFALVEEQLENKQVLEIFDDGPIRLPTRRQKRLFILRAAENPHVVKNGDDYYVIGGVMSHSDFVSVGKAAVVITADNFPDNAYMGYSIAE
ncbi:MAG: hypothetical protein H8F28_06670, partial [Fibrella sp.]|nr:hypothetical protein [Armatimonadota bacterium]